MNALGGVGAALTRLAIASTLHAALRRGTSRPLSSPGSGLFSRSSSFFPRPSCTSPPLRPDPRQSRRRYSAGAARLSTGLSTRARRAPRTSRSLYPLKAPFAMATELDAAPELVNELPPLPQRRKAAQKLASPLVQVVIISLICFCSPGVFNALSGMGGGYVRSPAPIRPGLAVLKLLLTRSPFSQRTA